MKNTIKSIREDSIKFMDHLALDEEPFGVYYDNAKPEKVARRYPSSDAGEKRNR